MDEKFYLTAAFPYPNSPQHIGHARTYTTTDVYARFKKLKGFNVLFPMAFHVTGTPILAMAKRLKDEDEELLNIFEKIYKIPREKALSLTDPKELVMHFSKEIEEGMREIGYMIDWGRKYYTFDRRFNKFIRWQFRKLHEKGYLKQGSHPVPWCPSCNNAIGAHDTRGDIDPEIGEYILIKFYSEELNANLLAATFRPETTYGVTNMWLNPAEAYVLAEINKENCIISKDSISKFEMGGFSVKIEKEIKGEEMLGKKCTNPLIHSEIPIFPASFVDVKNGTGVVMSVPAHAPFDYVALMDLKGSKYEFKGDLIQVLAIDGYGEFPAKEISEKMKIKNQQDPKLEEATREIYSKEAHTGIMVKGAYEEMKVILAKDRIKEDMLNENKAFTLHEIINGPVFCRCGALGIVKKVEGQWFIDYGNEEWKELARECLSQMSIIPEETRKKYEYTINWLKEKACARASGLGTRFPFDESIMIESLSDSTIYMAFYTIANVIKEEDLPDDEKESDEIFDYVFLGANPDKFKKHKNENYEKARKEFLYWYPLDSRHSAADLIHNHLTFFIFNHVAIFPKELWPRQIAVNGFVLMDGKKMSKSLMNILPLRQAIKEYGADVVRFAVVAGAELSQDSDFNANMVSGIKARMRFFEELMESMASMEEEPLNSLDGWFTSVCSRRMKTAGEEFESLQLRLVANELFYNVVNDLKWYMKRGGKNKTVLLEFFEKWIVMMWPFMPLYSEKLAERMGVDSSEWRFPSIDGSRINSEAEEEENYIISVKEDIESILKIIKNKKDFSPVKLTLLVASKWKRKLYGIAREKKKMDLIIREAQLDREIKEYAKMDEIAQAAKKYASNINQMREKVMERMDERDALEAATEFFKKEFGFQKIEIEFEEETSEPKAKFAFPMKPAIKLE